MCKTFYLQHANCTCIFIHADFTACTAWLLAHPESIRYVLPDPFADPPEPLADLDPFADPEDPFADPPEPPEQEFRGHAGKPKLLTWKHTEIAFRYGDIDFMSFDMDGVKAPMGVECPNGIIAEPFHGAEGDATDYGDKEQKKAGPHTTDDRKCPLCDDPDLLKEIRGWEEDAWMWGEEERRNEVGKGKGKQKGLLHKTTQIGTAAVKIFRKTRRSKTKKVEEGVEKGEGSAEKHAEKKKKEKKEKTPGEGSYLGITGNPSPLIF